MAAGKSNNFSVLKKISLRKNNICEEEEEPLLPKGAILRHPYEDCYILVIIGLAKQVHLPSLKATLQSTLLKHKHFSSIVVGIIIILFWFCLVI